MTYIDYLNQFNQWLEVHSLSLKAQILYFKLLNLFNRARWPETIQMNTARLMSLLEGSSKPAALRARNKLVEAGFIQYQRGKKGAPNRYALKDLSNNTQSVTESVQENMTERVTKNVTKNLPEHHAPESQGVPKNSLPDSSENSGFLPESGFFSPENIHEVSAPEQEVSARIPEGVPKNVTPTYYIKKKKHTKKKTVSSPLYPPEGGTDAANKTAETNPDQPTNPTTETIETLNHPDSWGFGPDLTRAFSDWLQYKQEKRQNYKPTGLKALIGQTRKYAEQYGEAAIADLIQDCMASGWTGIIWDRLESRRSYLRYQSGDRQSGGLSGARFSKAKAAGLDPAWDYIDLMSESEQRA